MNEIDSASEVQTMDSQSVGELLKTIAESQRIQTELLEQLRNERTGKDKYKEKEKQENPSEKASPEKDPAAVEINLMEVLGLLLKKWWLIVIVAALCALGAFVVSYVMYTPTYSATAKLYVNNATIDSSTSKLSTSDLSASQQLIKTYGSIMKTHYVLDKVADKLEAMGYEHLSFDQLSKMIESGSDSGTELFYITVKNPDPQLAIDTVNTIAKELPDQIASVIEGSSARIVDTAPVAKLQSSGILRNVVIAAFIGVILVCAWVFIVDYLLSDTIEDEDWLASNFSDIPFLGEIPDSDETSAHYTKYGKYGKYGGYASKKNSAGSGSTGE